MGVDYASRKKVKKTRKRLRLETSKEDRKKDLKADTVDFNVEEDVKKKRERKKGGPRRLCRGMCYAGPEVTDEDRTWNDEEAAGVVGDKNFDFPQVGIPMSELFAAPEGGLQAQTKRQAGQGQNKKAGPKRDRAAAAAAEAGSPEEGEEGPSKKKQRGAGGAEGAANGAGKDSKEKAAAPAVPKALRGLAPVVQQYMTGQGYEDLTTLQSVSLEMLGKGKNLLVLAPPGTGKTLSYVLPIAQRLAGRAGPAGSASGPLALIIAASKELVHQAVVALRPLARLASLRSAAVDEGVDMAEQVEKLVSSQAHVVVGTPGRLAELVGGGAIDTSNVCMLVLEGAEALFAPGKGNKASAVSVAINAIRSGIRAAKPPQVAVFGAASLDAAVEKKAKEFLGKGAVKVSAELTADQVSPAVAQVLAVCSERKKPSRLSKHLEQIKAGSEGQRNPPRVLVLAQRDSTIALIAKVAAEVGLKAATLGGAQAQEDREAAAHTFRSGKVQLLACRADLARGVRCRNVRHLVWYNMPQGGLDEYISLVGITGPVSHGHVLGLVTRSDAAALGAICGLAASKGHAVDEGVTKLVETYAKVAAELGPEGAARFLEVARRQDEQDRGEEEAARGATAADLAAAARGAAAAAGKSGAAAGGEADEEEEQVGVARGVMQAGLIGVEAIREMASGKRGRAGDMKLVPTAGDRDRRLEEKRLAKEARAAKDDEEEEEANGDGKPSSLLEALDAARRSEAAEAAAAAATAEPSTEPFIKATQFRGAKPGYAFKKGPKGLGYYTDVPPEAAAGLARRGGAAGRGGRGAGRGVRTQHGRGGRDGGRGGREPRESREEGGRGGRGGRGRGAGGRGRR